MLRTTKLVTISIPPALFKKAQKMAQDEGRTQSELFREALRRYVAEQKEWETLTRYGRSQARKTGIRTEKDIIRLVEEDRKKRVIRAS